MVRVDDYVGILADTDAIAGKDSTDHQTIVVHERGERLILIPLCLVRTRLRHNETVKVH